MKTSERKRSEASKRKAQRLPTPQMRSRSVVLQVGSQGTGQPLANGEANPPTSTH